MRWSLVSILVLIGFLFCPVAMAQTSGDGYLKQSLTGGLAYEFRVGPNAGNLPSAVGFDANYSYRPRRWLAFEAGFQLIPRPVGSGACCEYATNANDELYLVPIGARFVWEPRGSRYRFSFGAGGAYISHTINVEGYEPISGWVGQFVASGDYRIGESNKYRVGATIHYYYGSPTLHFEPGENPTVPLHLVTIGPNFIFSF